MSNESKKIPVKEVSTFNPATHKTSADRFNPGQRIYVRAMQGMFQRLRRNMAWFFMLLFIGIPWLNFSGSQAILFDIANQQYHFFSVTLWPQDLTLLALVFMIAAFALFFATTFFGRVWCGYLCPQTVWTFLYIWFEEKLEGSANKRRKQDSLSLTASLRWRKTLKHLAWLAIALGTGLTFVGYFVPIRSLIGDFFTFNASFAASFWVLFFTFCTYGNAGWMRSIVCVHMCPYARFQSAMFDQDTFVVGYDPKRGETRGPRSRKADHKALGLGDCIDCNLCVQVCPTGIDIRDGLQYECINCGACVDACDQTMARMGYEKGLIKYTTEHRLQGKKTAVLRPKLVGYGVIMTLLTGLFFYSITTVKVMDLNVKHTSRQSYAVTGNGDIENSYILKVINKTQQTQEYEMRVVGLSPLSWYGDQRVTVVASGVETLPISLGIAEDKLEHANHTIYFELHNLSQPELEPISVESRFTGPN
uniref:cytochrome c oxidase accessory protein CcoG n=1 Tax=Thaumasiovibrio occultus TaxID=1891184 RepID=UPI000B353971|nr:cytochrome c oxidase accessory protein CcoG [Thaumasiovibrio occultus]